MATLTELIAERTALEEKIKALAKSQRTDAIEKVRAVMREHDLTVADIGSSTKAAANSKKDSTKKVAAKYRDASGNTWSGRGLQPKWLKAALASGKTLRDFAV
jgi:DNA-binding protein H-NS